MFVHELGKHDWMNREPHLFEVEEHVGYVQDSLHRLLRIWTVFSPVR